MGLVTKNSSSSTFDGMDLSVNHKRVIESAYVIPDGQFQMLRRPEISNDGLLEIEGTSELEII